MTSLCFTRTCALLALAVLVGPARAQVPPAKPYGTLAAQVMEFLLSDVGDGGIRVDPDDPEGGVVPPYFYHYGIYDNNNLWSSTVGYPGYAAVSYPAYTASVAIDAFLDWRRYSGDDRALERARQYADWILAHRTPAADLYGNLPYSTQTDGAMGGGWDGDAIMTDKPAMFGLRLLRLHDITGDPSYWRGAVDIAGTLVATQRSGGPGDDGRWPFRVRPSDGEVRQDYTSNLVPAVRFFTAMARRTGNPGFTAAARRAWDWLLANPCQPASSAWQRWEGFYEDQDPAMQTGKVDHYSAHEMIAELTVRRPAGWAETAIAILDTAAARFLIERPDQGLGPYIPATYEWAGWMEATYAATLQFACASLRLHQALQGDSRQRSQWRNQGLEMAAACSWGQNTRGIAADGRMHTTLKDITRLFNAISWYEQNFNTVKYYLELMALEPALSPADEHHMLEASAELRWIVYPPAAPSLRYETAGGAGWEMLRVAAAPTGVSAGGAALPRLAAQPPRGTPPAASGWHHDPATGVLVVAHAAGPVEILFGPTGVGGGGGEGGEGGAGGAGGAPAPTLTVASLAAAAGGPGVLLRLATEARVTLAVHDLRGRPVRRLLEGSALPAGEHIVRWDGRGDHGRPVAGGLYLARATAASSRTAAGARADAPGAAGMGSTAGVVRLLLVP